MFLRSSTARSIQYTKTRTNSRNGQTDDIDPKDVIDISIQRYQVRDGCLERVDDLAKDGSIIRTMIADYRMGKVLMLDMRAKTYTTIEILKRQLRNTPNPAGLTKSCTADRLGQRSRNLYVRRSRSVS